MHPLVSKFFNRLAFSTAFTITRIAMSFLIMKLIAMQYGTSGVAIASQLQTFILILLGFVMAPISPGIIHFTAKNQANGFSACSPWWKASSLCVLFIIVVFSILLILLQETISRWIFTDSSYTWITPIYLLLMPTVALGTMVACILIGLNKIGQHTLYNYLGLLFSTFFMIIAIFFYDFNGVLVAIAIQNLIMTGMMLTAGFKKTWFKIQYFWGTVSWNYIGDILSYAAMAIATASVFPIALIITRNIMLSTTDIHATGLWQAVWKISEAYLGVISTALSIFLLPILSKSQSIEEAHSYVIRTIKMLLPAILSIAIMIYLMRDIILYILYTQDFFQARHLFLPQLIGDLAKAITWLFLYTLIAKKKTITIICMETSFALFFITSSSILIPRYGTLGATFAYIITYVLYLTLIVYVYNQNRHTTK